MTEADFFELVKFVRDKPNFGEERLQHYLDQGMWPDKMQEHVGFFKNRNNAQERKELLEEKSDTHENNFEDDQGWFLVIREREFID